MEKSIEVALREIGILREYLSDIANEPEGTGFDLRGHAKEALEISESLAFDDSGE